MGAIAVYNVTIMDMRSGYFLAERNGAKGNNKQLKPRERCFRLQQDLAWSFNFYKRTLSEKKAVRFQKLSFPFTGIGCENILFGYCKKFGDTEFIAKGNINRDVVMFKIIVANGKISYERIGQNIY